MESLLHFSNSNIDKDEILRIVSSPRDMIVRLDRIFVGESTVGDIRIGRAKIEERDVVLGFVRNEFGEHWVPAVTNGFDQEPIPIFIAEDPLLCGFACYDVVGMNKGVFGPMGTSLNHRGNNIGKALLYRSLYEMQKLGYKYGLIDNAGPIEFYEKCCGAVVIRT